MFLQLSCVLASKNLPKTLSKQGPNLSKIESKNHLLFYIDVLGFGSLFWHPWASKLEPSWPSWPPRTLPKACKIQSFAQGASQEAPKSLPRDPRTQFWNSWGLILKPPGSILKPPGLVFRVILDPQVPKRRTCTSWVTPALLAVGSLICSLEQTTVFSFSWLHFFICSSIEEQRTVFSFSWLQFAACLVLMCFVSHCRHSKSTSALSELKSI